jgi:hypothetical protein
MALHPWPRPKQQTDTSAEHRAEVEDLVRLREDAYLRRSLGEMEGVCNITMENHHFSWENPL